VQVSASEGFEDVVAEAKLEGISADTDFTVRVKVTGLAPRTRYFYRFVWTSGGIEKVSAAGRTKTLADASDAKPAEVVLASCQDFTGRYYNPWSLLLALHDEEALDPEVVVWLGDYVYETDGSPGFQAPTEDRTIRFRSVGDAQTVTSPAGSFHAARSLENYRDLYRAVRSDATLREVHRRFPFIAIWDDHEFANDCWQDSATFLNGLVDERSGDRRRAADRAWFEYMPFDDGSTSATPVTRLVADEARLFPQARIERSFDFGGLFRLVMTETRSRRPDHLIPEDAFPGTVVLEGDAWEAAKVAAGFGPSDFTSATWGTVDIDSPESSPLRPLVVSSVKEAAKRSAATWLPEAEAEAFASSYAERVVKGRLATVVLNAQGELFPPTGRGLAYAQLGKRGIAANLGSRYLTLRSTFDLYAGAKFRSSAGASEDIFGAEQEQWIVDTLASAPQPWKILASSVTFSSLIVDLSQKTDLVGADAVYKNAFYLNVDGWDGFARKKGELFGKLDARGVTGVVGVCGDIHAAFLSREGAKRNIATVTTPAISSASSFEIVRTAMDEAGIAATSPVRRYVNDTAEALFREANDRLLFADVRSHGFTLLRIGAEFIDASWFLAPFDESFANRSRDVASFRGRVRRVDWRIGRDGACTPVGGA
jgi:alkaline phosphatase D